MLGVEDHRAVEGIHHNVVRLFAERHPEEVRGVVEVGACSDDLLAATTTLTVGDDRRKRGEQADAALEVLLGAAARVEHRVTTHGKDGVSIETPGEETIHVGVAAVDRLAPDFAAQLRAACPAGVDIFLESVHGESIDTVLPLLRDFARMPLCGIMQGSAWPPSPADRLPDFLNAILFRRIEVRSFTQRDIAQRHMQGWDTARPA